MIEIRAIADELSFISAYSKANADDDEIHDYGQAYNLSGTATEAAFCYCRKVIPTAEKISFWYILKDEIFSCDGTRRRGLINVRLEDYWFRLFIINDDEQGYLFIECNEPLTKAQFNEYCWSIIVAVGYLIGSLMQDEEYNFYYSTATTTRADGCVHRTLRNSIRTISVPTHANPNACIEDKKIADSYQEQINEITEQQLCKLCTIVHNSTDIKAMLLLVLESMKASLLVRPAGLAIALETLNEYAYMQEAEVANPIADKQLSKKIRQELLDVVGKYKGDARVNQYDVLVSNINNLNSPPNSQKLKVAFITYGIALSEVDEEVLMYRNDFLHGNINLKPKKGSKKKTYRMGPTEISYRLYTLINCVMMKMIGYSGYVQNHVKIQEAGMGLYFEEPYYRPI